MKRCAATDCREPGTVEVRMERTTWMFCSLRCLCRRMFEVWAAVEL